MQSSGTTSLLLVISLVSSLGGHPPDEDDKHDPTEHARLARGMILPQTNGPTPWSDKPVLNDPSRFSFAVMTDRTGGHRPGIWMKGVRQLNLMRPEFVVSVGDLIEGYTEDETVLQQEWKEFLGFVDKLDMRFFFVAGNHDLTNPVMHRIWREKFGPEWYSFDYKNVHFICLSTEDPQSRIGDKQLAWLARDLREHKAARWTLIFLHKPLWTYAEREIAAGNPDRTNWQKVEKLIGQRPHTVFAGHVHHYVQYDRNGAKYYHLATTGGGSRLRGRAYGEFDHVVWVTMERDGPRVANLLLDGVLAPDVVTEQSIARHRSFLEKATVQIAPILIEASEHVDEGTINIRLSNEFDEALEFSGQINGLPLRGLTLEQTPLALMAEPGGSAEINLRFRLDEPVHFEHFAQTTLTANLRSVGSDPLSSELAVPVTIDRRYPCPRLEIQLDGRLGEWTGEEYGHSSQPLIVGASEQWQGPTDGSVRFRIAHDDTFLYISGRVLDDRVVEQDRLYFNLDARPFEDRVRRPRLGEHTYVFMISPPKGTAPATVRQIRPRGEPPIKIVAALIERGYDFEVALPISCVTRAQSVEWESFQFSPVVSDIDEPSDQRCWIVWRGTRELREQNRNFAHFFRSPAD